MSSRATARYLTGALLFGVVSLTAQQSPAPDRDPLALPVISIAEALTDRNGDTIPDRLRKPVHVRGVVTIGTGTLAEDRLQIYIQDETGGIAIFSREENPPSLPPGTVLDAGGILEQYRGAPQLVRPRFRVLGRASTPRPVKIPMAQVGWRYYGRLVEIEGRLGEPGGQGPNIAIPIRSDGEMTSLLLPPGVARVFPLQSFPPNAQVSAVGVVSIYSLTRPHRDGFRLVVASPSNIRLISRPAPRWVRVAAASLSLALLLAASVFLLVRIWRRQAERRERHVTLLNEMSSAIGGPLSDVDSLLEAAIVILSRHRLIEGAIVHLLDGNVLRLHRSFGIEESRARIVHEQIEQIQSRASSTFTPGSGQLAPIPTLYGSLHPLLCLPLQGRSRMIGILTAFTDHRHTPTPAESSTIAAAANLIAFGIENIQMLQESEQRQEDLKQLAITDPLTGLYNRRFLSEYLRIQIPMARRQSAPLGFIAVDLDRFKEINDTYGHATGDLLLAEVGKAIRRVARASDLPVRLGGEEFLVVMPDTNERGAVAFAGRLQKEFTGIELSDVGVGAGYRLTASFGIGIYPDHGENVSALLHIVDEALYESKRAGRDRITIAPAPFHITPDEPSDGQIR